MNGSENVYLFIELEPLLGHLKCEEREKNRRAPARRLEIIKADDFIDSRASEVKS